LTECAVWIAPPVSAGGDFEVTLMAAYAMARRHDARAEELGNLRLALATFALQLDAFELRAREGLLAAGIELGSPAWQPDRLWAGEVGAFDLPAQLQRSDT
jgi:hypothetical protein